MDYRVLEPYGFKTLLKQFIQPFPTCKPWTLHNLVTNDLVKKNKKNNPSQCTFWPPYPTRLLGMFLLILKIFMHSLAEPPGHYGTKIMPVLSGLSCEFIPDCSVNRWEFIEIWILALWHQLVSSSWNGRL